MSLYNIDNNIYEKPTINIAILGCISSGKSTLMNSFFSETYSDMKIMKTTMIPQIYNTDINIKYDDKHTKNNSYFCDEEINKQNLIFNQIQNSINYTIHNLIGSNLSDIVKLCQKIDICIANSGSGICLYNSFIFNKPCILFTLKRLTCNFNIQRHAFENKLYNAKYLPRKYIIDSNNNNFYLKYGILIPLVISLIDELILPLKYT